MNPVLQATWRDPPGLWGTLCAIDHKTIGKRYLVTAFGFFLAAGLLAALMRLQLARPESTLIGPDLYNQLFTTHGTAMMFLFAVPVMQGMAIYLVPLMVGARAIAFPRMNAFAYWIYLFGGLFLFTALLLDIGPDAGWFSYVPLAGPQYTPGKRADVWAQMITFTELSGLLAAIVVIATVFKLRAPGMTLARLPLFVWAMLVTAFMILFAMPSVMLASTALISTTSSSTAMRASRGASRTRSASPASFGASAPASCSRRAWSTISIPIIRGSARSCAMPRGSPATAASTRCAVHRRTRSTSSSSSPVP